MESFPVAYKHAELSLILQKLSKICLGSHPPPLTIGLLTATSWMSLLDPTIPIPFFFTKYISVRISFSKLLPENCSYQDLQQTPSYIKWLILSLHLIHLFYFFWRGGGFVLLTWMSGWERKVWEPSSAETLSIQWDSRAEFFKGMDRDLRWSTEKEAEGKRGLYASGGSLRLQLAETVAYYLSAEIRGLRWPSSPCYLRFFILSTLYILWGMLLRKENLCFTWYKGKRNNPYG